MSVTREEVAQLYVATFDRAPDTSGLVYWSTNQNLQTIELIAESFFDQPETQEMYPSSMPNEEFVNNIYNNVLNRDADPAGLAYWANALNSGAVTRHHTILAIANGAVGQDRVTISNKTEVGLYYAQFGEHLTGEQSYEIMKGVTDQGISVSDALNQVDTWAKDTPIPIEPDQRMTLTTKVDTIEGSDISSIIYALIDGDIATNSTLNDLDTIDGGGGDDTLKLKITGKSDPYTFISNMQNVETLIVDNDATVSQTVDLFGSTGVTKINIIGGGAGASISSLASLVDLEIGSSSDMVNTIGYDSKAVEGTTNSMFIALNTTYNQTVKTNGVESISIATNPGVQQITIGDAQLDTIVVTGGGDLTLGGCDTGDSASDIDLSATTGSLTIKDSIIDTKGAIVKGGQGNDTITGSAIIATKSLTINGNKGDDTIDISQSIAKSINTVTGDAGNDTIIGGAGVNSITGGVGVDSMTGGVGVDTFQFANSGDTGITEADSDTITLFATGSDKIDFNTLPSGTGNFNGNTVMVADFNAAKGEADKAMNGTIIYAYEFDAANGYLFVDINNDGTADQAIILSGLGAGGIVADDIIA